jgi:uncharacterized membrane protein YkvI
MDALYALHLLIFGLILSIPLWPIAYLKYGVYVPILLSTIWLVCNGCPLTKIQKNLNSDSFTREVYSYFMPNISSATSDNINTFALLLITTIGFQRLKCTKI